MFSDDIFSNIFKSPFFDPFNSSIGSTSYRHAAPQGHRNSASERCSLGRPRDIFTEFSRAIDNVFAAATSSFFENSFMLPRSFYPSYARDLSYGPSSRGRSLSGVTLNGDVVERIGTTVDQRHFRHTNNDPVHMERTRLQWYDSNTRRALLPPPPPNRPEPSGRLTAAELAKLPISTYRIKPGKPQSDESNSNSSPVPVLNKGENSFECSPGSAYLQPQSRTQGLVKIQPIQSSPSRGQPECEVCLTEYRNNDQLRHLPCGHAFHTKCIDVWFRQSSTCPKCRAGVRTGLKRLERNRLRSQSSGPSVTEAPVRAIRQRPTGAGTNQRTSPGNANSRSVRRPNDNSPQPETSVIDASRNDSSSDSFQSPTEAGLPRMVNPNSPLYSSSMNARRSVSNNRVSERTNQGQSSRATGNNQQQSITRNAAPRTHSGGIRSTSAHSSTPIGDKSAFARRMAAEAAIRRAELARQQRATVAEETRASGNN